MLRTDRLVPSVNILNEKVTLLIVFDMPMHPGYGFLYISPLYVCSLLFTVYIYDRIRAYAIKTHVRYPR